MVSLTCAEPLMTRETVAGETPASAATLAMVVFLAVVVSFDDPHDVVWVGQSMNEWFHAVDASARHPVRAGKVRTPEDFLKCGATFCGRRTTVTVEPVRA
ncbi:hypothetical protein JCM9957A_57660 [Kineosporia succinea]